jgi:hypothetical protein
MTPPSRPPRFATALWNFVQKVVEEIDRAAAAGELLLVAEPYVAKRVTSYTQDPSGGQRTEWRQEFGTKSEWPFEHQYALRQKLKGLAEYVACLESIQREFSIDNNRAELLVDQLSQYILRRAHAKDVSVPEIVSMFLADLHESECDISVTARLLGISLTETDHLDIGKLTLRKVETSDLEYERPLRGVLMGSYSARIEGFPSAILQFQIRGGSVLDGQRKLFSLQRALSLFRLGAVRYLDYECELDSITRFGGVISGGVEYTSQFSYSVGPTDLPSLKVFLDVFEPLVGDGVRSAQSKQEAPIIAFERYSDALNRAIPTVSRITSAITALEALYFKRAERSELTYKLGVRAGALLRIIGKQPLDVQRKVTRAYSIRSSYIHGGSTEGEKPEETEQLCRDVLEYARLSTQVFLQLKTTAAKEELIGQLDDSLLDSAVAENLKKRITALVTTP